LEINTNRAIQASTIRGYGEKRMNGTDTDGMEPLHFPFVSVPLIRFCPYHQVLMARVPAQRFSDRFCESSNRLIPLYLDRVK
jgi:hypothetical protein